MATRADRLARRGLAAGIAVAALAGCVQDDGRRYDPIPGRSRMSTDSERELGWEFDQQAQKVLPLVTDLAVLEFLDDLGDYLVEGLGDQPFDYRFRVVMNPALNAFAVPGGYVYLHSGLLLAAGDVSELAGVMAHELAHVKSRHHARLSQQTALPSLLTSVAGLAAGVATGSAGPIIAAQGLNVALQLQYTREFEDEADRVGAVFLTRAGWPTDGMVRFFERLLLEKDLAPQGVIPPYLFSHPQVENRIDVVRDLGDRLHPMRTPPDLRSRFREMQARVAFLLASRRESTSAPEPFERGRADALLETARREHAQGRSDAAQETLLAAEQSEAHDPRIALLRGDIAMDRGDPEAAVLAYRRAVHLDPYRPAVLLKLARAHRDAGDQRRALFFADQAIWRSGDRGTMRLRAERELERLMFPVIAESGFEQDPSRETATAGEAAPPIRRVALGDDRLDYWARVGPHYADQASYVELRWIDPGGVVRHEGKPDRKKRVFLSDRFEVPRDASRAGTWRLEVLLADDVVASERFEILD